MTIRTMHQIGHCANWNIDAFELDHCGDGLILSPVHQHRDQVVNKMNSSTKKASLFDPQYYVPNSPKKKLGSYEFFPEAISGGYETTDFPLLALESARKCVDFQIEQDFLGVIIPARFSPMRLNYFEFQEEYAVSPFLQACTERGVEKPIFLTLAIDANMLADDAFKLRLLNWVTGFPMLTGVYLCVHDQRTTKQIRSKAHMDNLLSFSADLKGAGLDLVIGYLNTECVVLSLLGDVTLSMGSFENTRIFSIDKFIESDEERRAPRPRIYLPGLLNWIQYDQAVQIRDENEALWDRIYTPTSYGDSTLAAAVEPAFNQPGLYKHHFLSLSRQLAELSTKGVHDRYHQVRSWLTSAISYYEEIHDMPIDLDLHGRGEHLQPWLDALNTFYRRRISS